LQLQNNILLSYLIIPILFIPSIFPDLIATLQQTIIKEAFMLDYQRFNYISACCKQKLQISCNSDSYSICNNILKINAF